ncbi:hypothetical protein GYMLUDRAFT_235934 [Collybiopsis luxurians FD-317 M1]|nr:hypothetical protein GYMLUDRAFT_235934 [Collybiopsis luxurians FD-317 M1]
MRAYGQDWVGAAVSPHKRHIPLVGGGDGTTIPSLSVGNGGEIIADKPASYSDALKNQLNVPANPTFQTASSSSPCLSHSPPIRLPSTLSIHYHEERVHFDRSPCHVQGEETTSLKYQTRNDSGRSASEVHLKDGHGPDRQMRFDLMDGGQAARTMERETFKSLPFSSSFLCDAPPTLGATLLFSSPTQSTLIRVGVTGRQRARPAPRRLTPIVEGRKLGKEVKVGCVSPSTLVHKP